MIGSFNAVTIQKPYQPRIPFQNQYPLVFKNDKAYKYKQGTVNFHNHNKETHEMARAWWPGGRKQQEQETRREGRWGGRRRRMLNVFKQNFLVFHPVGKDY